MNEAKNFNAEIPLAKWAKGIIKRMITIYITTTPIRRILSNPLQ